MIKCSKCGFVTEDIYNYYPMCGTSLRGNDESKMSAMAVTGFIFSIFSMIVNYYSGLYGIVLTLGIVCSSVGISNAKHNRLRGKKLGIAGLIISIVSIVSFVILMFTA